VLRAINPEQPASPIPNLYRRRGTMKLKKERFKGLCLMFLMVAGYLLVPLVVFASEADLAIPDLHKGAPYTLLGGIRPWDLLFYGACIIAGYQLVSAPPGQEVESA
jgi:hypothetical protein